MVPSSPQLHCRGIVSALVGVLLSGSLPAQAQNVKLIDDRPVTIKSAEDVARKRQQLIHFIWGPAGVPADRLPVVEKNDRSPVRGLKELDRVDTLTVVMEAGQKSYAHHFLPRHKNNRLVILHHGHAPSFDDNPAVFD
jgi:hypothetical protein